MKKNIAFFAAALVASFFFLQNSALGNPSLLLQIIPVLAASNRTSGTTEILIGDQGIITAFKGKQVHSTIRIFVNYVPDEGANYTYTLLSGPTGLSVSSDGVIEYDVLPDTEAVDLPFSIKIAKKTTGKSYVADAEIAVAESEVVASGSIGPEGGEIKDEWGDVLLTVPVDAVEESTLFEVLRGVNEEGYYIYTIRSANPVLKILDLRLPDPILRQAPEGNEDLYDQNEIGRVENSDAVLEDAREAGDSWSSWRMWAAGYAEMTTGYNVENRLRSDIDINSQPAHENINNNTRIAAQLLSLCRKDSYEEDCGGMTPKTPVVFIHGYNKADLSWNSWNHRPELGGGEGTWGQLPELIDAKGYAVFEFSWRTNARFVDAAANFADAIRLIQEKSHKKVHIIAHSFGGLVSRAYLQNYAVGRPYQDNVQSLITLGTPHSGIFDADGDYHGLFFRKGQDSSLFGRCMQISCHQAGQETPDAWTIEQAVGPDIDSFSIYFGIDKKPGKFIAQIQDATIGHGMPVNTLTLIGLPVDSKQNYKSGDDLISYSGQRFSRTWKNSKIRQEAFSDSGGGKITEKILGVSHYDFNATPGAKMSETLLAHWQVGSFLFRGYFHSDFVRDKGGVTEAGVENSFDIIDEPHAALTEIIEWLNPSDTAEPETITLSLHVVDADSQQPITGAKVYFNANGTSCSSSAERYGVTDIFGNLTKELPFYPLGKYTALVIADGYHQEEFDNDYAGGLTPELSPVNFGNIELQSIPVPTVTSSTGRVWMDRNLGASRVAISPTDEEAYGDLYQWGRLTDGHEKRTSGTIHTRSNSDVPGHGNHIIGSSDWRNPQNDNLWQGASGVNNPCPVGFRLPTSEEFQEEIDSWSSQDSAGSFASPLKLVLAGYRSFLDGLIRVEGYPAHYWTSTVDDSSDWHLSDHLNFCSSSANISGINRGLGMSVRCIKDEETLQCGGPQQEAGRDTPELHTYNMGTNSGSFQFSYETFTKKDRIIVKHDNVQIFDTGCVGEARTKTINFSGSSTTITVEVLPNCAGDNDTAWNYTVNCPNQLLPGTCADRGLLGPELVNWQGRDWQRCEDEDYYNWSEAIAYCESLTLNGYDDWRLPTKDELKGLVVCSNGTLTPLQDYDSCQDGNNLPYDTPTIDGSFECSSDCFWSSSAYNQFNSWYVCFSNGFAGSWGRPVDDYFRARCVR